MRQTDVFLSYSRSRRDDIQCVIEVLEELDLQVWWDARIPTGVQFQREINEAVESAKCVVVCWTHEALTSDWVLAEALKGFELKKLVQVKLDDILIPIPFNEQISVDFRPQKNGEKRSDLKTLAQAVGDLVQRDLSGYLAAKELNALTTWASRNASDALARRFRESLTASSVSRPTARTKALALKDDLRRRVERADREMRARNAMTLEQIARNLSRLPVPPSHAAQEHILYLSHGGGGWRNRRARTFADGWIIASQLQEGQEALAKAQESYNVSQQLDQKASLFGDDALRAVVCGGGSSPAETRGPTPCLAVAAGSMLFIVDAGAGAAEALSRKSIPLGRLQAVLLTGADPMRYADLDALWADAAPQRHNQRLPIYGPTDSHRVVQSLNETMGVGPASGLEPWAPAPKPGKNVIVYQADGLVVSAFTTERDAYTGRVGYRFDFRGRSLVVAGDGRAEWAEAQLDADIVLHGASFESLAALHATDDEEGFFPGLAQMAHRAAQTHTGENTTLADMQVRKAISQGVKNASSAHVDMLLELPLTSREISVRSF